MASGQVKSRVEFWPDPSLLEHFKAGIIFDLFSKYFKNEQIFKKIYFLFSYVPP